MKSIANKILYSLNGAFNFIGKELGHLYELASYVWTTITGTNITLNNTANAPMRINPNPTAISQTTYTGKNKLNNIATNTTTNGITYTINSDRTFSANGTATGTAILVLQDYSNSDLIPAGTYILSIGHELPSTNSFVRIEGKTDISGSVTQTFNLVGSTTETTKSFTLNSSEYLKISFVIASGSSVSNVKYLPMISTNDGDYEPYVGGTASPNPSYPQDIHIISGDNTIVIEGKNLLNLTDYNSNYSSTTYSSFGNHLEIKSQYGINANIVASSNTYKITGLNNYDLSQKFNFKGLLPNTQYTISCNISTNIASGTIRIFDQAMSYTATYKRHTFTTDSNGEHEYTLMFYGLNGANNYCELSNIQLELGNIDSPVYIPYVSQEADINLGDIEYCKIGDYEDKFVRSDGENLAYTKDGTYTKENNTAIISNSLITLNTSSSTGSNSYFSFGNGYVQTWAPTDAQMPSINDLKLTGDGGNYIATMYTNKIISGGSVSIRFYTSNNRELLTRIDSATTSTLNISLENGEHIKDFGVWSGTSTTFNDYQIRIMLNKGTTALPYTPYEKGWYYKQGIGKVVLDGSETYGTPNNISYSLEKTELPNNNLPSGNTSNYLISHFTITGEQGSATIGKCWLGNSYLNMNYDGTNTNLSGFKSWLSNNNVTIYYALATPTYTKITGELANQLEDIYENVTSYDGQTNISQINNDLPFELIINIMKKI